MAGATWTPATNGNSATWSKNQTLSDILGAASLYDDPTIAYDSAVTYYDGYDPTTTTPEGETGATWLPVAE